MLLFSHQNKKLCILHRGAAYKSGTRAHIVQRLFNLTKINSSNVNDNVAELMCICLCLTSYETVSLFFLLSRARLVSYSSLDLHASFVFYLRFLSSFYAVFNASFINLFLHIKCERLSMWWWCVCQDPILTMNVMIRLCTKTVPIYFSRRDVRKRNTNKDKRKSARGRDIARKKEKKTHRERELLLHPRETMKRASEGKIE